MPMKTSRSEMMTTTTRSLLLVVVVVAMAHIVKMTIMSEWKKKKMKINRWIGNFNPPLDEELLTLLPRRRGGQRRKMPRRRTRRIPY